MKTTNTIPLKTLAMKARVYNQIRTDLYKKKLDQISKEDKIKLFDKIFQLNHITHWELNNYKAKRQYKTEIHQARIDRGYKFKKKQTKEEIEKYLAITK